MNFGRFAFAAVSYVIVAVLLEQYDQRHGSEYVWWYTAIIWLTFATANRADLTAGLNAAVAEMQRPIVNKPLGSTSGK